MFNDQSSNFDIKCLKFNIQSSIFNVPCSMFNVQFSVFNIPYFIQCGSSNKKNHGFWVKIKRIVMKCGSCERKEMGIWMKCGSREKKKCLRRNVDV